MGLFSIFCGSRGEAPRRHALPDGAWGGPGARCNEMAPPIGFERVAFAFGAAPGIGVQSATRCDGTGKLACQDEA